MSDCRNDCRDPLAFPRRILNRPALGRIGYRIGTYAEIREALLHWIDTSPGLQNYAHRKSDEPGIALLEGAAILGDILTFYQEAYANESFLRTASWRDSVADLVRLIGYRLSPGIGGRGTFAFEVRGDKAITIPRGFRVSAEVTGREGQSDFETVASSIALPALSRFSLHRPPHFPAIGAGSTRFSVSTAALAAAGVTLEKGDRVMINDNGYSAANRRQLVVIDSVRQQFEHTEFTVKGRWEGVTLASPVAYKVGRSFRYFGHNGPEKKTTVSSSGTVSQQNVNFTIATGHQPGFLILLTIGYQALPTLASFPLDQQIDDLAAGGLMLATLSLGESSTFPATTDLLLFERRIKRVHNESLTRGAVTGGTTVVDLDYELAYNFVLGGAPLVFTDIRTVTFYEVIGERFAVSAARASLSSSDLTRLYVFSDPSVYAATNGRRIQLARGMIVEDTVVATDPAAPATGLTLRPLTLSPPLRAFTLGDFPLEPTPSVAPVVAYGNLIDATQGRTERDAVLGNGDSRESFQSFKLPKAPLTYHNHAGATPPEKPELQIWVGDRMWTFVPSLFGRGPKDEVYIVREDANFDSWVQFGDNETGSRLPSGIGNVRAIFRTGNEAYGPLREDTNVQPGGRLDRLDKIRLLGLSTGGDTPEAADNARAAAPGKLQSLGRLVSITDFESEALAIAGVWRVRARWATAGGVPAVVVIVLMKTGRDAELSTIRNILAGYNRCRGPQRFPIIVEPGQLEYLYLDASMSLDPSRDPADVLARIQAALGVTGAEADGIDGSAGLMAPGRRQFGGREYATRIAGVIQNVSGVVWADVSGLGSLGTAGDPTTLTPPAAPWPLDDVVDCAANRILALHRRHVDLKMVAAPGKMCAS